MTDIQITPKYSYVKPQGYYVYLHRRATDGIVFYVGKGIIKRGWDVRRSYNPYWCRIAIKHGVHVEVCQDGMEEEDASLLEMWLIAKLKYNGEKLSNLSSGGEGYSGFGAKVHCSNGMVFDSITSAEGWLRGNGFLKASAAGIINCCNGKRKSAYGYTWSYDV